MKKINLDSELFYTESFDFDILVKRRKTFETKRINWFTNSSPRLEYHPPQSHEFHNKKSWINYKVNIDEKSEFQRILNHRESTLLNKFTGDWTKEELFILLSVAIGPSDRYRIYNNSKMSLRTYPSGGAQYSIKNYIIINKVKDIEAGLYFISPEDCSLIPLKSIKNVNLADLYPMTKYKLNNQSNTIDNLSFSIFMIIDYQDTFKKYGELSDRLGQIEAGHIGQNLQLTTEYLNKKSLPICGIFPEEIEKLLDIKSDNYKYCIYSLLFG